MPGQERMHARDKGTEENAHPPMNLVASGTFGEARSVPSHALEASNMVCVCVCCVWGHVQGGRREEEQEQQEEEEEGGARGGAAA